MIFIDKHLLIFTAFTNYRPDLVDFSKLSKSSPEQNLEYSFHVAEKELGVPRLLDVEGNWEKNQ